MNHVSLIGHLTKDPKLVDTQEKPICEMRVAVDNGRYQTTFVDVRVFGEAAYACAEYLHKGRRVGVAGKLAYSEWRKYRRQEAQPLLGDRQCGFP